MLHQYHFSSQWCQLLRVGVSFKKLLTEHKSLAVEVVVLHPAEAVIESILDKKKYWTQGPQKDIPVE